MFLGHRKPWEFGPREGWVGAGGTEVARRQDCMSLRTPWWQQEDKGRGPEWCGQSHLRGRQDVDIVRMEETLWDHLLNIHRGSQEGNKKKERLALTSQP